MGIKTFDTSAGIIQLGLAHGPGILETLDRSPELVDYVEMPFEQLRHNPGLGAIQERVPIVLHCASLSVAGFVPPSEATLHALCVETDRTQTPWIGEHLAFVSADGISEESDRDTLPTNLTYTLCPQLSEETIDRVVANLILLRSRFSVPLILENSPQYFSIPGSTMSMVDFVARVASCCDAGLLLDLSHFMITSLNTNVDAFTQIDRLPLERVVEIHISGMTLKSGVAWDDHAEPAPSEMFDLLNHVMERAHPRALTLEYNWLALPEPILISHMNRARTILARA
jgi:uncharacterized protein (UPF0276 family)